MHRRCRRGPRIVDREIQVLVVEVARDIAYQKARYVVAIISWRLERAQRPRTQRERLALIETGMGRPSLIVYVRSRAVNVSPADGVISNGWVSCLSPLGKP